MGLRRRRGDDGVVLLELAIVMPVLVLLVLGIAEFGMGWRDRITVQNAVRSAARVAGSLGDEPTTDYQLLQNLRAGLDTGTLANVRRVIVYRSQHSDGRVPTACLVTSQSGLCNVYDAAALAAPASSFGCDAGDLDERWCPTGRRVSDSGAGPDYLGIYVEVDHDYMTALFDTGNVMIVDRAVTRLEVQQ